MATMYAPSKAKSNRRRGSRVATMTSAAVVASAAAAVAWPEGNDRLVSWARSAVAGRDLPTTVLSTFSASEDAATATGPERGENTVVEPSPCPRGDDHGKDGDDGRLASEGDGREQRSDSATGSFVQRNRDATVEVVGGLGAVLPHERRKDGDDHRVEGDEAGCGPVEPAVEQW